MSVECKEIIVKNFGTFSKERTNQDLKTLFMQVPIN